MDNWMYPLYQAGYYIRHPHRSLVSALIAIFIEKSLEDVAVT